MECPSSKRQPCSNFTFTLIHALITHHFVLARISRSTSLSRSPTAGCSAHRHTWYFGCNTGTSLWETELQRRMNCLFITARGRKIRNSEPGGGCVQWRILHCIRKTVAFAAGRSLRLKWHIGALLTRALCPACCLFLPTHEREGCFLLRERACALLRRMVA